MTSPLKSSVDNNAILIVIMWHIMPLYLSSRAHLCTIGSIKKLITRLLYIFSLFLVEPCMISSYFILFCFVFWEAGMMVSGKCWIYNPCPHQVMIFQLRFSFFLGIMKFYWDKRSSTEVQGGKTRHAYWDTYLIFVRAIFQSKEYDRRCSVTVCSHQHAVLPSLTQSLFGLPLIPAALPIWISTISPQWRNHPS